MKALPKAAMAEKEKLIATMRDAENVVASRIQDFNAAMIRERERLEAAIENLNVVIAEANAWRDDILGDLESYIEDRSEKWQESDTGQEYAAWKSEYETTFEEVEIDWPDKLPDIEESRADAIDNLNDQIVM